MITTLRADSLDEVATWEQQMGQTFPVLFDGDDVAYDLWKGGAGQPWFIVFDQELNMVDRDKGAEGHEAMEALALELAEQAASE
ncbi:MAG: hypothetical protein VX899_23140 [Myxococcota bacterium]|nr:hypothetical protein [Myxococcota bacterium]